MPASPTLRIRIPPKRCSTDYCLGVTGILDFYCAPCEVVNSEPRNTPRGCFW